VAGAKGGGKAAADSRAKASGMLRNGHSIGGKRMAFLREHPWIASAARLGKSRFLRWGGYGLTGAGIALSSADMTPAWLRRL
jgi:hypothetical protein